MYWPQKSKIKNPWKLTSILKEESDSLAEKSNKLFDPKFEEHLHKKAKLKTESKKLFSKASYNKHGNNKSFLSGPPPNTRGGGQSLTLFLCTSSNTAAKKMATRKVKAHQRNWERTYLNNSWSLMKNQLATRFLELITSLDYVNPIKKKLFPHHLKNTPLAGRITNFVLNWSKLTNDKEILQIVKGLKIQFLERPSQRQTAAETKMSLEEIKLVDTQV